MTKKYKFPNPMEARRLQVSDREVRDILEHIEQRFPIAIADLDRIITERKEDLLAGEEGPNMLQWQTAIDSYAYGRMRTAAIEIAIEVLSENGWDTKISTASRFNQEEPYLIIRPNIEWLKQNVEGIKKHVKHD